MSLLTELVICCGRMFHKDVAPLALGNGGNSGGERAAVQTLREVRGHPVVAKRLDCACLQHRFRMTGAPFAKDSGADVATGPVHSAVRVIVCVTGVKAA